ncbi:caspase family protein [Pararhizobium sp. LjRoot235]|uniref:caspase family protein n=1 Tax=Pararhizobium sp. LjRoot235 TaxID=3342291 RepID=UPI003ED0D634
MQEIAKRLLMALAFVLWAGVSTSHAADGRRLALVIGSSAYEAAGNLPNAVSDARQFGAFLSSQGFDTDIVTDADRREMADAVSRFARKIGADDVALFYFAGHGMQLRGENYLVGTDARLASEFDVAAETLALTDVIGAIEKKSKIALFFLDACRNNPLANRLNQEVEGATRSIATRGLAPVETESAGTMVAFAAAPGQVASDGSGKNSPFTVALIGHLAGPGLEIGTAFKRVIRDVRKATDGKQSPQILSSLALEFYFNTALPEVEAQLPAATPAIDPEKVEAEADFEKALRINTPRIWKFFLAKHRSGEQSNLARQILSVMEPTALSPLFPTPEQAENELALNRTDRSKIQLALAAKGFGAGNADGVFGAQTRRAITDYQKSASITGTGYFNEKTAKALGIDVSKAEDGLYSSPMARLYMPKDFAGLETDARVLKAVDCDPWQEKVYGSFEGHMYVVIRAQWTTWKSAALAAKRCGGYLATVTSEAENNFIASLFNKDSRLFQSGYDASTNTSYKMGPWIGLIQDPAGREPRGGWQWESREPMSYAKWYNDIPNEYKPGDDYAMFYAHRRGKADLGAVYVDAWDDMGETNSTHSFVIEFE